MRFETIEREPETKLGLITYAGLGERLKAFLLDYLLILAYIILLAGVNYGLILSGGMFERLSPGYGSPWIKDGIAFLTLILPVILYFTWFEGGPHQATWGKRRVGLRVVDPSGRVMTRPKAFLRNMLKFLPWQLGHTSIYQYLALPAGSPPTPLITAGFILTYALVFIYFLYALISKQNRTPYDVIAGTLVIANNET